MRVKRFVADSMQDAIARVKQEYGQDAVILQTRTYRRGLFGLMGRRRVEVLAAIDAAPRREAARRPENQPAPAASAPSSPAAPAAAPGAAAGSRVDDRAALLGRPQAPSPWRPSPPLQDPGIPSAEENPRAAGDGVGRGLQPQPSLWAVTPSEGVLPAKGHGFAGAVALSNGHKLEPVPAAPPGAGALAGGASSAGAGWPLGLERIYRRLVDRAVEPPFARRVVEGILPLLPPGVPVSEERMLELARDHLASLIPISPSLRLGSGPRRVVVLVGPTGVGKTTSLAKLAAHYGLMAGQPVGLLTFDTYRVGAAEQLRTYAEIIGLPMEVVYHPGELEASLDRMADRRLILVDTAGRSPQDLMRLQEMRGYLSKLPAPEVYLVLSATVRYADMVRAAERFEPLGYQHLILTKVDETTAQGMVLNAVFHTGRPLAYLSTGQDVPDDFEAADPDRIAAQLLEDADE